MVETSAIFPVSGIRLGSAAAAIKRADRDDLTIIEMSAGGSAAAVFTRNAFCAAPVVVAREHLTSPPRWMLVNSGNANAGTGERGLQDARRCCSLLAGLVDGQPHQVLPFSTGVIGEYLPVEKIEAALPDAVEALSESGWERASKAIVTTDTRPKLASRRFEIEGRTITMTGIAKGAGMIQPSMATMLAFIGTDARVDRHVLQPCLAEAVAATFNGITVDGDTSTNDACAIFASGASSASALAAGTAGYSAFKDALTGVCAELAEAIVRDGEGATKLIRIVVEQARDVAEACEVAKTVAHSPLVKTAFFASDPNWGRILAAVGRSHCPELEIGRVALWLGDVPIVIGGERAPSYTEAAGQEVMNRSEITVRIALGRGDASCTVLTCDLSYEYVRINAEYRT
ncbi:MAG: bifunctional glutamate N-acetyltransferase/amino-acid acetyltransferase ArgJ [Methylotetracoccus sp.]|nr:bifunctional glutamate N-acetyltransferase/amino-acid acetyltransferase ArgJ [Methylotetracoccus sp.]